MKVIKEGKNPDIHEWSAEFECTGLGNEGKGCGAILLVKESDLYRTASSHYDGSNESYTTFMCPQCGAETDVTRSDTCYRHKAIGSKKFSGLSSPSRAKVKKAQEHLRVTGEYIHPHRI
jgi:predicted RNA-binding Zn-ribbon protein involved in translation (DUF1610 family)